MRKLTYHVADAKTHEIIATTEVPKLHTGRLIIAGIQFVVNDAMLYRGRTQPRKESCRAIDFGLCII